MNRLPQEGCSVCDELAELDGAEPEPVGEIVRCEGCRRLCCTEHAHTDHDGDAYCSDCWDVYGDEIEEIERLCQERAHRSIERVLGLDRL